jgi:hypothetical protein
MTIEGVMASLGKAKRRCVALSTPSLFNLFKKGHEVMTPTSLVYLQRDCEQMKHLARSPGLATYSF